MRYGVLTFIIIGCLGFNLGRGQVGLVSKGNWVKIAVPNEGVYQVSGAQLKAMGFTGKINASQVQLFGMDLSNLNEKVPNGFPDSLSEMAIVVEDGGDGILEEQDRFLFYAQGSIKWVKAQKEVYPVRQQVTTNDSLYYFIQIGTNGKRVTNFVSSANPTKFISTYPSKWLLEKDTINFLNSGKIWLGEPMGSSVGKKASLVFQVNMEGLQFDAPLHLQAQLAAATYQSNAIFNIKLNEVQLLSSLTGTVSGYLFDDAYKIKLDSITTILDSNNLLKSGQNRTNLNLQVDFKGGATSTGWIDFIALHGQRKIGFWGNAGFSFDYQTATATQQLVEFEIQNASSQTRVWDISKCLLPIAMPVVFGPDSKAKFISKDSLQKQFYVFESNKVKAAQFSGYVLNDSNFNTRPVDYIIVTAPDYFNAALKLKKFHETQNGFNVSLIRSTTIYNEFASGQTNPIAIRNYLKYIYENAKRLNQTRPTYLLLLGMGNFDAHALKINKELPVYTSDISNSVLTSYSSDDFYAILKNGDQIQNPQTIDSTQLAVGRIPARTLAESELFIQKIIQYKSNKKTGLWKEQLTWIADDADYNLHLQDAEEIVNHLKTKTSKWNHRKLYLDLFKSTQTLTGTSYPGVNKAIFEAIQSGTLVLNYTGHGNYLRLSEEAVIAKSDMASWDNASRLPIMVTASCDFAPYDQPALTPIGFDALMQNEKGIIALVAANRLVFAYSNKQINDAFMQALLVPNENGVFQTLGKALQNAKKYNFSQNGDRLNAFKFGLMGDPALSIDQPRNEIRINQINASNWSDTLYLNAGEKYTIKGAVTNQNKVLQNFNGLVDIVLWDAPTTKQTFGNQSTSQVVAIEVQDQAIFRGKATVQNGLFEQGFILPISAPISTLSSLKLQLYAYNDSIDASKQFESIYIRNTTKQINTDTVGPKINAYVQSSSFKQGDWVTAPANLIVALRDSAGIQSSGNVLGQDLKLIIDDSIATSINLNTYFTYDLNQYQAGKIQYPLPFLMEGKHKLIVKAWDLLGNLSKDTLRIEVPSSNANIIRNLTITPNPVQSNAKISFEIKNSKDPVTGTLEVFDQTGKRQFLSFLQKPPMGNKIVIEWDGRNKEGGIVPPGLYIYRVKIRQNETEAFLSNTLLKF